MHLYLVRHGEAVDKAEDPDRPLSSEGQNNVSKIAGLLPPNQISVQEVFHSDKLRAIQTAKILTSAFAPSVEPKTLEGLAPEAEVSEIADWVNALEHDILLVGHIPFMERFTSLLLAGKPDKLVLQFAPAMIACFKRNAPSDWSLCWALDPHMINY